MKITTKIWIAIAIFWLILLGILLFRYYFGCYDYSCAYLCLDNPNFLTKLLYRCAENVAP